MNNNNRKQWVDIAKGMGIILVVLAHALDKESIIWRIINQFHMPLFYMISGYLYRYQKINGGGIHL